jgi:hypothetical protein
VANLLCTQVKAPLPRDTGMPTKLEKIVPRSLYTISIPLLTELMMRWDNQNDAGERPSWDSYRACFNDLSLNVYDNEDDDENSNSDYGNDV